MKYEIGFFCRNRSNMVEKPSVAARKGQLIVEWANSNQLIHVY
jgi:hypothetical protein